MTSRSNPFRRTTSALFVVLATPSLTRPSLTSSLRILVLRSPIQPPFVAKSLTAVLVSASTSFLSIISWSTSTNLLPNHPLPILLDSPTYFPNHHISFLSVFFNGTSSYLASQYLLLLSYLLSPFCIINKPMDF